MALDELDLREALADFAHIRSLIYDALGKEPDRAPAAASAPAPIPAPAAPEAVPTAGLSKFIPPPEP